MTFARIYVNYESREMYTRIFHITFEAIAKDVNIPQVTWKHLHDSGIGRIVMDMDSKQMSGMSSY